MRRFERLAAPSSLTEAAPEATRRFVERRAVDPSASFFWPQRDGASIYEEVRSIAGAQTDEHCSYCDGFPIGATGRSELDHFVPKEREPGLAYDWNNLYLACTACNGEKLSKWDPLLLRPDAVDYSFSRYFCFDTLHGSLLPQPGASEHDQARARRTIEILGLNRNDLCRARRDRLRPRRKYAHAELAYRFLFVEQPDGAP